MASIIERGNSCSVVYYVNGKPKWEACQSKEAAQKRKIEVEYQQSKGTFVPPSVMTVADLMEQFIETYGKDNWGHSYYKSNVGLISNYILPHIGSWALKTCSSKRLTNYFTSLRDMEAVSPPGRKTPPGLISDRNIYEIYGLLNIAFRLAVEWEELGKHPLTKSMKPSSSRGTRDTWDGRTAKKAVAACESLRLLVYIHLALGCSMRIGEISGMLWTKVLFDEENDFEDAQIKVDSQLSRISRKAFEDLRRKQGQIKMIFPEVYPDKEYTTHLVLKEPKTKSSIRTVYLPKTTARLLYQWKNYQDRLKLETGKKFQDFNLVMTLDNGRPVEARIIGVELDKLIQENGLPDVDFHSLRHTSTSVKLIITGGDIKGVQGDTGHAVAKMVTDTYAEIDDHRRQENARKFDESFFADQIPTDCSQDVLETIIAGMLKIPNMKEVLQRLLHSVPA